uniref:G protein-coupled receptor n=1 Tax=Steinernema glaseri TaxID=37863 RepID=A0A1I7ZME0_9BILA
MTNTYEAFYDRILDVTAVINVPIKIFVMVIVIRFSTPEMRSFSLLLLNGLFWNFMANFIFAFLHVYPMFPAECFRADGLVSLVAESETFGHIMFCVLFFCILNCVLALSFTFPYRYFIFAHPITAAKIKRHWGIAFLCGVHVVTAVIFVYLYSFWVAPSPTYPVEGGMEGYGKLFCFKPQGPDKNHVLFMFLIVLVELLVTIIASTILLFLSIHRLSSTMNSIYLRSHKRLLWALLLVTSIPMFLGGIPLFIVVITAMDPHLPFARPICMICAVIIANHGTAYAIALIFAIRPYRIAVQQMVRRMRKPSAVGDLAIISQLYVTNIPGDLVK